MQYKCLICGQIIDNAHVCPICGATEENIVPYIPEVKKQKGRYRCRVCGAYIDNPYHCPVCGANEDHIFPVEDTSENAISEVKVDDIPSKKQKYRCLICGAIIDSPDYCPIWGATSENIVVYEE